MREEKRIGFLGNSLANVLVGAATTAYVLIVPAMVVRRFGSDQYGTWYLAFQISAYVLLLDLGSQHVVTNEAARPVGDAPAARLATAAAISQAGLALAVVAAATSWAMLTRQRMLAQLVAVLGIGAMASLLASTVRAWFGGLQRAHVPAIWLIGARVAGLAGLTIGLAAGWNLVMLTCAVVAPQLVVHGALLAWARRPPSPWARPDRTAFVRLAHGSMPLAIWTLCGIVIAGIDIFVVRAVDPAQVGRYAIALPLIAVPTGAVTAAVAAWIPRVAHAQGEVPPAGARLTLTGTTVTGVALAVGAIPFVAYAGEMVRVWAGRGPWGSTTRYLELLYLASCLRFVFLPWAVLILVRGEQRRITFAPLTEAAINLAASVLLGLWIGALGVAIGTVVGALAAAVLYLLYAVPRTAASGITGRAFLRANVAAGAPLVAALGLVVLALVDAPLVWRTVGAAAAACVVARWLAVRPGARTLATIHAGRGRN